MAAEVAFVRIGPRTAEGIEIGLRTLDTASGEVSVEQTAAIAVPDWDALALGSWADVAHADRTKMGRDWFELIEATTPGLAWAARRRKGSLDTLFDVRLDDFPCPVEILADPKLRPALQLVFDSELGLAARMTPSPVAPSSRTGPLRVLVIVGPDQKGRDLAGAVERRSLVKIFARRRHDLDVRCMVEPSRAAVSRALGRADWKPHVIHFVGHADGKTDPAALLVGESGPEEWSADQIGVDLQGHDLDLVVLNACGTNLLPTSSTARAFLDSGARAVIATGRDIRGATAERFARELYDALVEGTSIGASMARARRALREEDAGQPDFATPQLILQGDAAAVATPWALLSKGPPAPLASCDGASLSELEGFVNQRMARAKLTTVLAGSAATGAVVAIHGEAETGKTTLLKWFAECAHYHGALVRFIPAVEKIPSGLAALRRIRDGAALDPAAREAFREFTIVTNDVLHGRRPGPTAGVPLPDDSALAYADAKALPDWEDHAKAAFARSLQTAAAERPIVIAIELFDALELAIRKTLEDFLLAPIANGRVPGALVVLTYRSTESDTLSSERVELAYPSTTTKEAWETLEDYLSVLVQPSDLADVIAAARFYFTQYYAGPTPKKLYRLHKLPDLKRFVEGL